MDERAEEIEDLDHAKRVDGGRRLVEDEDVRRLHQRVRDAEALLHAARVRLDAVVGTVGQTDLLEDLVHRGLGLATFEPVEAGRVAQVLAAGEAAVEADGVGEVADPTLDLAGMSGRIEADDARLAARRLGQTEEHEDRGGLARAVRPEQPEDLAGSDLQIELVDRGQRVVALRQRPGPDERAGLARRSGSSPAVAAGRSSPRPTRTSRISPSPIAPPQEAGLDRDADVAPSCSPGRWRP